MIRIRRLPSPEESELHRRLGQVVEGLFHSLHPIATLPVFIPRADIHETASGIRIVLDLAGVTREDLDIVIEGRILRVAGSRADPEVGECLRYQQMEIPFGPFERIFHLPEDADAEGVAASYRDGFLMITVPLSPRAEGRQVPVEKT